jgi:hypothetical protein
VTGVSTMCPSSVEEPKAGQKRPRKRFFTSIQVNQPSAPAPAPASARRILQLATPHDAIHPILTDCSTTITATSQLATYPPSPTSHQPPHPTTPPHHPPPPHAATFAANAGGIRAPFAPPARMYSALSMGMRLATAIASSASDFDFYTSYTHTHPQHIARWSSSGARGGPRGLS